MDRKGSLMSKMLAAGIAALVPAVFLGRSAVAQEQKIGDPPQALNMRLAGCNDLQGRSAYQPVKVIWTMPKAVTKRHAAAGPYVLPRDAQPCRPQCKSSVSLSRRRPACARRSTEGVQNG